MRFWNEVTAAELASAQFSAHGVSVVCVCVCVCATSALVFGGPIRRSNPVIRGPHPHLQHAKGKPQISMALPLLASSLKPSLPRSKFPPWASTLDTDCNAKKWKFALKTKPLPVKLYVPPCSWKSSYATSSSYDENRSVPDAGQFHLLAASARNKLLFLLLLVSACWAEAPGVFRKAPKLLLLWRTWSS